VLTVSKITKSFGGRVLFEDASLQVNPGDRIGLVGPNGAGKSTLFSLILGDQEPDAGVVAIQRGARLGYLPQEHAPAAGHSVIELATEISPEMSEARRMLREHADEHGAEHHEALDRFAELDGYAIEAKAKRVLTGLAFRESDFERPASALSGGWVMRAHLARLLVMEPDLLMLDEPTNNLDLESLGWFQSYLKQYPGAILMISHDREFLNALCGAIVEIGRGTLTRYRGNYDSFLEQKQARAEQQLAAYKNQQREIESLQRFVDRFRAKASKAAQAQEKLKQIARMERIAPPEEAEATVKFRFPQPARSGQRVITLRNVRQAYGEHVVYDGLEFAVERGQRTVLVGPNGAGKSTLLKILAGVLPIQHGERTLGHQVTVGYFAQHRTTMFDPGRTVLQEAQAIRTAVSDEAARTVLGSFLFRGDDVFKRVSVLSGGEKSRLALVKLLLDPPNLLLMDEPTTHLDIPSIDALIGALRQYEGTLVFVSHDVYFIRAIATTVLHISAGQLTPYAGDYQYYLDKTQAGSERGALTAPGNARPKEPERVTISIDHSTGGLKEIRERRKAEAAGRQAQSRARRECEKRAQALEAEVLELERRQTELTAELERPETYENPSRALEINRELSGVTDSLDRLTRAWELAVEELGGLAV
jgi:ATP-binding cassette subfamily F protein 3